MNIDVKGTHKAGETRESLAGSKNSNAAIKMSQRISAREGDIESVLRRNDGRRVPVCGHDAGPCRKKQTCAALFSIAQGIHLHRGAISLSKGLRQLAGKR